MSEREGVARLTRVARVAEPTASTGLMPPPRTRVRQAETPVPPAGGQAAPAPAAPLSPTGVARLTPRAAAVERAARELRQVMGRFATGVTVVTTLERDTIHGMTANAFLSVSLHPPLVLVSLGRCRMGEMLPRTKRYGVSILAHDQMQFADHFAARGHARDEPRFTWHEGLPLLDGALAHLVCRVVDTHPAGDHVLWIGEVEHLHHRDGEPLLFYTGRFGTLRQVEERLTPS
ncbi:MAG TPA: flavin reductase family protein [Solirubrobacteraceae bacterium]|nr:flavin reductase family protein [Solirubrobacteraceae bacterium]